MCEKARTHWPWFCSPSPPWLQHLSAALAVALQKYSLKHHANCHKKKKHIKCSNVAQLAEIKIQ